MTAEFAKVSGMDYSIKSTLFLTMQVEHTETDLDFRFLTQIPTCKFKVHEKRRKGVVYYEGLSLDKIENALDLATFEDFALHNQVPPAVPATTPLISSTVFEHSQIFIAGRYCKLQRGISNSPWFKGSTRLAETSVEELIGDHLDAFFRATGHKFSSSGREDADVLMLGRGRPFYFELTNPRRALASDVEMEDLENRINTLNSGKISVRDLQIVSREDTNVMKDSVSTKSKSYSCLVEFATPVSIEVLDGIAARTNIEVKQQNPTRVPRRADLLRDKMIETIAFRPRETVTDASNSGGATLVKTVDVDLRTSAGTYVKEFVHGDDGRTKPCLATLAGVSAAKVITLDVLDIHLDWPPEKVRSNVCLPVTQKRTSVTMESDTADDDHATFNSTADPEGQDVKKIKIEDK
eukprot:jgi/Hompol1/1545/HPOL_002735-RA